MKCQLGECGTIIPPFQPDLEKMPVYKNRVVKIKDNSPVSGIISDFSQFAIDKNGNHCYTRLIPDSFTYLIIELDPYATRPFLFTCSQYLNQLALIPNTEYFCVRFYPGPIGNYFHCHSEDFLNRPLYLDEVMPKYKYEQLLHKLHGSNTFEQRIEMMSKYIAQKHAEVRNFKKIIQYARNQIIITSGTIDIDTLSKQTAYSGRYLRGLFLNYVGFSPKAMCELIKFQKSFTLYCNNHTTLRDIAYICGYSDHSQMDKAYIRIVNRSPTILRQILLAD